MRSALTYYRDIPLTKEEYALKIGMTIIDTFQADDIDSITIIPFDKKDYSNWLGDRSDTQDMRASWAGFKLGSIASASLTKLNQVMKTCPICGITKIMAKQAKFCSNACKQKNKNSKKKGEQ
jgi:hypothetical protein